MKRWKEGVFNGSFRQQKRRPRTERLTIRNNESQVIERLTAFCARRQVLHTGRPRSIMDTGPNRRKYDTKRETSTKSTITIRSTSASRSNRTINHNVIVSNNSSKCDDDVDENGQENVNLTTCTFGFRKKTARGAPRQDAWPADQIGPLHAGL